MQELFKQEINFAQIILYKNYSDIQLKKEKPDYFPGILKAKILTDEEDNDIFEAAGVPFTFNKVEAHQIKKGSSYTFKLYPKDHHHFFYTDIPKKYLLNFTNYARLNSPVVYYDPIKLINPKVRKGDDVEFFETTKDEQIKRHYNNPFAEIRVYRIERWIKREGDKVTIKLYINVRERGVNKIYFTKRTQSTTLTFNMLTGNFNVINYQKAKRAQMKHFYANSFTSLKQALGTIYTPNLKLSAYPILMGLIKEFDNYLFHFAVKRSLNLNEEPHMIDVPHDYLINDFMSLWILKFATLRKIKIPDDSTRLLTNFYPTEKYLKKNNRKLIAAILDRFGVKSNITIKILHENTNLNMISLVGLCRLFGKNYQKYIGNVSMDFFEKKPKVHEDLYAKNSLLDQNNHFLDIEPTERENLVKIVNDYIIKHSQYHIGSSHELIPMFSDHFTMLKRVKEYYPELRLRARTYETFCIEHTDLSQIERSIRREFSIHYIFDEEMIDTIEKPIETHQLAGIEFTTQEDNVPIITKVFIPKILKTTEDYLEEGSYMHHCVGGYIEQENSIIISLRHERERVTCEFDAKTRRCIQAQYFTNDPYPSYYEAPLLKLKERVSHFSGKFGSIEKIKKRLQINGKEVKVEEEF